MILQYQSPCLESFALCTVQIHQDRLRCPYLHCTLTSPVNTSEAHRRLMPGSIGSQTAHPSPSLINLVPKLGREAQQPSSVGLLLRKERHRHWLVLHWIKIVFFPISNLGYDHFVVLMFP